jgi:hypothetical protein
MFQDRTISGVVSIAALLLCQSSFATNNALVVGVNACSNYMPNSTRPRPLAGAEADAYAFAELLQHKYGFPKSNVHLLTAEQATHQAIANVFHSLEKELAEGDQFVFYFAGHGTQVPNERPYPQPWDDEPDAKDEALCPHDAAIHDGNAVRLIVDDELAKWLNELQATRITVVLDCCHAGTGIKAAAGEDIRERALPPPKPGAMRPGPPEQPWEDLRIQRKGPGKNIAALYASGPQQPAVERKFPAPPGPEQMRGQFSRLLIDYLNGPGADASLSQVSAHIEREIADWAQKKVSQRSGKNLPPKLKLASEQRPAFEPTDQGDRPLIIRQAQ